MDAKEQKIKVTQRLAKKSSLICSHEKANKQVGYKSPANILSLCFDLWEAISPSLFFDDKFSVKTSNYDKGSTKLWSKVTIKGWPNRNRDEETEEVKADI